LLLPNC